MNTPTHLLIALASAGKPGSKARNMAACVGGIAPDAAVLALFGWARLVLQQSSLAIFRDSSYSPAWQTLMTVGNSLPLFATLLAVGLWRRMEILSAFAAGGALHIVFDFFTHADDAHAHLWPLTDRRFHSPLSYWDAGHYGHIVAPLELAMSIALAALLLRRYPSWVVRVICGVSVVLNGVLVRWWVTSL